MKIHPLYDMYGCNPDTGEIINVISNKTFEGKVGHSGYRSCGVRSINVNKRFTKRCHRFIWECVNGNIPEGYEIDHINCNRCDNRIVNLRCISMNENRKYAYEKRKENKNTCKDWLKLVKYIKAINIITNEICCFRSKNQCAKFYGISPAMVYLIAENKNNAKCANTSKGRYTFEYINKDQCENLIPFIDPRLGTVYNKNK